MLSDNGLGQIVALPARRIALLAGYIIKRRANSVDPCSRTAVRVNTSNSYLGEDQLLMTC